MSKLSQMSESVSFDNCFTKCHLRALSLQKPFLFVGMGSTLHVLNTDTNELVLSETIFKTLTISGIQTLVDNKSDSDIEIIVSINGNRFLSIYKFLYKYETKKSSFDGLVESHNFYDWILLVKITQRHVFVVKAHNEVVIFDLKSNQILDTILGIDRRLLYSAELLFVSDSLKGFVLSSGTVFKEIVIWSSCQTQTNCGFVSKSLQRLKGHDGVIFAINYSKPLNLLVSASDDRSLRIWRSDLETQELNESFDLWHKNRFTLSHVFYGHLSRIWSLFTLCDPFPIVISVGEDSSLYFWNINEKKLIQRVSGHKNSSVWCLTADLQSMIAFSGGSDSCLSLCHIFSTITPFDLVIKHDFQPKQLVFTRAQSLHMFCTTVSGHLVLMSANSNDVKEVRNCDNCHVFETYSAIDVNEDKSQVVLGSKCGNIAIVEIIDELENPLRIQIKKVHKSKVFSICFIDSFHFMSCGFGGELKVWTLKTFTEKCEYLLPDSRHRWPVAGLLYEQLLIVGDRCGSVYVYDNQNQNPIKEFRHLHGSNGVTAIKLKPKTNLMYSSGRNGKIFEFILEDNNCCLLRIYRIFSDMEWIGNFQFDGQTNDMSYIYGFESRNFMVWDEREQRFIEAIDCGGGHRAWDLTVHRNHLYFCYTKKENIFCYNKQLSQLRTDCFQSLVKPSHSNKINCCSLLCITSSVIHFATAGEDNVIHINRLNIDTNEWKVDLHLFGHISNISAISSHQKCPKTCFMVSVGGRSQLMVWKIHFKDNQLICKQLFNKFLWTSDNIQNRTKRLNAKHLTTDPQIRYLDACMTEISEERYLISTACSDSAFRLFVFDLNSMEFQLLIKTSFNMSCILRVFNVFDSHVITASNDGTIKIWSLMDSLSESISGEIPEINLNSVFEMRFHESGINALDVLVFSDIGLWLIGSGGDDNALVLSLMAYNETNNTMTRSCCTEQRSVHSSQITGIKIISSTMILSAAIDQRVIVWRYGLDLERLSLTLEPIASYITTIADISSIFTTYLSNQNKWHLIICGEGFEAIKYSIN